MKSTLKVEILDVENISEHPDNARLHNVDAISKSLTEFGQYQPIVVQLSTKRVIAGNGRLAAARSLGWTKIAAVVIDVDDDRALEMLLVDNRTSDLASYDPEALAALLEGVADLVPTGYSTRDLDELLRKLSPPTEFPTVEPEENEFAHTCPKCSFQFN